MDWIANIPVWGWVLIGIAVVAIGWLKLKVLGAMMNKKQAQEDDK